MGPAGRVTAVKTMAAAMTLGIEAGVIVGAVPPAGKVAEVIAGAAATGVTEANDPTGPAGDDRLARGGALPPKWALPRTCLLLIGRS